jgi:alcohol dehydrogenase class IV
MAEYLRLNFPGRSYVGCGAIEKLGPEAAQLGSRALLVTGRKALEEAGITDRLTDILRDRGVDTVLFDDVPPEPDLQTVDKARGRIAEEECDLVVEAGGGSALDAGKAAAALAHETEPTEAYHQGHEISTDGLPHIAVATTSGTGAEVTRNSVLIDVERNLKKSIRGDGFLPDVSVTDAELTVSCPPPVTAGSGMDALVQAIESYLSRYSIPTTEALSLHAVKLIWANLPVAFGDGENLKARAALAEGSYMAGLALGSARLGAVHGMAHPVGLVYEMPHGAVCAALMPPVLRQNVSAVPTKYERLSELLKADPAEAMEGLLERLNLPHELGPYPDAEGEKLILDYALNSGSSAANPSEVDAAFVKSILRAACSS